MQHQQYKFLRYLEDKLNVRLINGRVYKTKFFFESGNNILDEQEVSEPYKALIKKYPVKGSSDKAFQNMGLFIEMIYRLDLHKKKDLRILDIGSRAGLFPYFCQYFGHQAVATDLKEVIELSPTNEILSLLDVNAMPLKIEPFVGLPDIDQPFDLITGFRTRFHSRYTFETGLSDEIHWGKDEWAFFLSDISKNYLASQGKLYLILNRLQERSQGEKYPLELRQFFQKMGGMQRYNELIFDNSTLRQKI